MKRVIRRNCFETNSSSMHSILVNRKLTKDSLTSEQYYICDRDAEQMFQHIQNKQ